MRVPLLAGSRVTVATLGDDVRLLLPPAPLEGIADVEAAVRDALAFPLGGEPLADVVRGARRVTIVIDPGALPGPLPAHDPRQDALHALVGELEKAGVPSDRQTILMAGGLGRRHGVRELEAAVGPHVARRFAGRAVAHDADDPDLVTIGEVDGLPLRVGRALADADAIVTVSAAETLLHGGPGALLASTGPETIRQAFRDPSLLEVDGPGWRAALEIERSLGHRAPLFGVSLALAHPQWPGVLRGFPYTREAIERTAASPLRRAFGALPAPVRRRILLGLRPELRAQAVFAGRPSVAHAEALLRGIEFRSLELAEPLDAVVIGIPPVTPTPPLERPNPLHVAYLGLGLALRLWRGAPPVKEGGTLVLLHRFHRRFAHPTQAPYRAFFAPLRHRPGRQPEQLAAAEEKAARDPQAVLAYRQGRSCHPRLPFAEWEACSTALMRLGSVLIAGCRDAAAARQLGFVPVRGLPAAFEMVRSAAGPGTALGCLLAPPFFPLALGE